MFTLPNLRYSHDSLDKFVDTQTMQTHHLKHHQTYINNLNQAITNQHEYQNLTLTDLVRKMQQESSNIPQKILNNTGGHYNHSLFWYCLSPLGKETDISSMLQSKIEESFGSLSEMKKSFSSSAMEVFGSGWAWLSYDFDTKLLFISNTSNQDIPKKGIPVLLLDVWEHAYYLRYKNLRKDYVDAFWNTVDWKTVSIFYEKYALNQKIVEIKNDGTIDFN